MESTLGQSERETRGKGRCLLLVDADPLLRWSVKTHLGHSFDVVAVDSLKQAEEMLDQHGFDAIIVSANEGESAQGLVTSARAANPQVRIVWLTTGSEKLEPDPAAAYIEKPFRLSVLAQALHV